MRSKEPVDFCMDMESLGVRENAPVLSWGAIKFVQNIGEKTNQELFDEAISDGFHVKLDVKEQLRRGRKIDKDTAEWWKKQGDSARKVLSPSNADITTFEAVKKFHEYLLDNGFDKRSSIWAKGYVDFMWYFRICDAMGIEGLVQYWQYRCGRTALYLALHPKKWSQTVKPDNFVIHDAVHDSAFLMLQMIDPFGERS